MSETRPSMLPCPWSIIPPEAGDHDPLTRPAGVYLLLDPSCPEGEEPDEWGQMVAGWEPGGHYEPGEPGCWRDIGGDVIHTEDDMMRDPDLVIVGRLRLAFRSVCLMTFEGRLDDDLGKLLTVEPGVFHSLPADTCRIEPLPEFAGWLPMETAPRCGEEIMVRFRDDLTHTNFVRGMEGRTVIVTPDTNCEDLQEGDPWWGYPGMGGLVSSLFIGWMPVPDPWSRSKRGQVKNDRKDGEA